MFQTTSATFDGRQVKKSFAWSYTKIKNFRACPKRYFHYDVAKDVVEEKGEELIFGDEVHKAMQFRLMNGTPLPPRIAQYEKWCAQFLQGTPDPRIQILVEQKFAIREDLSPCTHFFRDKTVWFRAIADAVRIEDEVVASNWDWKTGKIKDDPVQILLAAAAMFAHFPKLQVVKNSFIWLTEDVKSSVTLWRKDLPSLWAGIMPEVQQLELAHQTDTFPPKRNGLCRQYCGVVSCPYHGG